MASYPSSIKSFTPVTAGSEIKAVHVNDGYGEIEAIETELGTDPAGSATDLKTRLARSLDGYGNLDFAAATTLTISSGSVTPTQNWHLVDTEGAASSDDLDIIATTNVTAGFLLIIRQVDNGRNVVLKHATGNLSCIGGKDCTLDTTQQFAICYYDGSTWLVIGSSNLPTTNDANTFSGMQTWSAAVNYAYTAVSANTTLTTSHYCLDVDATGGAITITLPTAVGCAGRVYIIRKSAGGNSVTVDGAGSETINGSATVTLADTYDCVTVMSDGAGWIITASVGL